MRVFRLTSTQIPKHWSTTVSLLLLLASLLPTLTLAATPLASPVPVAETLDPAAIALTPIDLDELGLPGFGQQTSAFLTLEQQVEELSTPPSLGMDAESLRASLTTAEFQRRYERQLGLPPTRARLPPASALSSLLT